MAKMKAKAKKNGMKENGMKNGTKEEGMKNGGLTAAQKKLPPALQKAIMAKKGK